MLGISESVQHERQGLITGFLRAAAETIGTLISCGCVIRTDSVA